MFMLPDSGPAAGQGGAGGTGSADAMTCGREDFEPQRLRPELLLVLDRSKTMGYAVMGSASSRWAEVSGAVDQVVMHTQGNVSWGLKLFPTAEGCEVSDQMEVPAALDNHPAMSAAMKGTTPNVGANGTPMRLALRKATLHLQGLGTPNGKYLLIGTDGLPNCAGDSRGGGDDTPAVIEAIREAATAGIKTFVVGIATHDQGAKAQAALDQMAEAGGAPRAGTPKYYAVNNRQDLVGVLNDITTRIATCDFPLSKTPPNPNEVHVKVGGAVVKQDPADGWSFGPDMKSIRLNGAACTRAKQVEDQMGPDVQIVFGCPGLVFE
jgi:hypothetical protein